jgi:hypothetical protein
MTATEHDDDPTQTFDPLVVRARQRVEQVLREKWHLDDALGGTAMDSQTECARGEARAVRGALALSMVAVDAAGCADVIGADFAPRKRREAGLVNRFATAARFLVGAKRALLGFALTAFALLACAEPRPQPQQAVPYYAPPPGQFVGYPPPQPPMTPSQVVGPAYGPYPPPSPSPSSSASPLATAPLEASSAPAAPPVTYAQVSLVGLTIAPAKYDGHSWDPGATVDPGAVAALGIAMKLPNAYSQVLALLAGPSLAALAKPDVYGTGSLVDSSGSTAEIRFGWVRDSFTPSYPNVEWQHVPIDSTRVRVTAFDHDLRVDDPVGTFELGPVDFHQASDAGHVFPVRVDEQTNGQILFASISVFLETAAR